MDRIVGAFIFPDVWQKWTEAEARGTFEALADFGINAIFTEAESYRDDLIALAHQLGLRWFGAIACFSDHAHHHQLLHQRPELWPIDETGQRRRQMEWYIGVTPTFEQHNTSRLELAQNLVEAHHLDGFFLDFIRWPIHWELELRPGAGEPLQSSFDSHTLDRFQKETGMRLPKDLGDTASRAHWILTHHSAIWRKFKCAVITDFVRQAVTRMRAVRGTDLILGLYAPPLPVDLLESLAGQLLPELASLVDVIAPMAYHAILHRPPQWVGELMVDLATQVPHQLLPVLQVDSKEGTEVGADWGPPIPLGEWETVLRLALDSPGALGLVAFTGTALFGDGRGPKLQAILST
ncbi:hypothetical protein MYX82_05345 [Acidobacteria bacterium AH-259-D05]|nr:hypothetical protein [Acidobacteria bacterium AH-259-D05]